VTKREPKKIQITITDDLERNYGHRLTFRGLQNVYPSSPEDTDHTDFLRQYNHDKTLPPYWSAGIAEMRCFTLPYAIYLTCYDLCQWHEDLQLDGDEFVFEWEGQTFTISVGTWPVCEAAWEAEKAFRAQHGITKEQARGE
jgi:hypothetical protein